MKWATVTQRTRLYLISAAILVTGLLSAVIIYLRAESTLDNALIDEFEYSKRYRHDLELYGGKANVVATEITNWFTGLWHGKQLAYTLVCLALMVSFGFFFAARHIRPHGDSPGEKGRERRT